MYDGEEAEWKGTGFLTFWSYDVLLSKIIQNQMTVEHISRTTPQDSLGKVLRKLGALTLSFLSLGTKSSLEIWLCIQSVQFPDS